MEHPPCLVAWHLDPDKPVHAMMLSNQHIFGRLYTTSRSLDKLCHHGVFNAVVGLSHHRAKMSKLYYTLCLKKLPPLNSL